MADKPKKLFLVKCQGMTISLTNAPPGIAYVIATDPQEAYEALRKHLDEKDYGYSKDREFSSAELLAEASEYPECNRKLIIA